ncbi:hypothetical protein [Xanthomonas phage Carpasina]|uniref:Uncharacterized protein n=1 Tax=Xanthomonas phage Carpasina TaxID=2163636 RepID=A0A2S1GSM7_9CAUD|nr:hypothetical protein HOT16_gp05 [Xanthomonas phage Carpasina]AWD92400.1 hypothetical protein [Xanthomonas phage Carpasina]
MRVFKVEFKYIYVNPDGADVEQKKLEIINRRVSALSSVDYLLDEEELKTFGRYGANSVILNELSLLDLMTSIPDEIESIKQVKTGKTTSDIISAINQASDRFERMAKGSEDQHEGERTWDRSGRRPYKGYNDHTGTHISNNVMTSFNQVLLMEDACTDNLQDHLNEGWRVIAVCPQAARRPDYILGKFNPDIVSNPGSAPGIALRA